MTDSELIDKATEQLEKATEIIKFLTSDIAELEALRKKELDFYLWDKKRLSRSIAGLTATLRTLLRLADEPERQDLPREMVSIPLTAFRQAAESLREYNESERGI